jgi:hypothetical protein
MFFTTLNSFGNFPCFGHHMKWWFVKAFLWEFVPSFFPLFGLKTIVFTTPQSTSGFMDGLF